MAIPAMGVRVLLVGIVIVLATAEFLPLYTGGYEHEVSFLSVHVGAASAITFLVIGIRGKRNDGDRVPIYDLALALLAGLCTGYFTSQGERIAERIAGVDIVFPVDMVFGILLILVLLEACRRVTGRILTGVAAIFIAYIFLGPYIPGPLSHRGMTLARFIDLQVLSTFGIFGTPISASAHMVFYFIIVGAFLERSGAGKLFVNIAQCFTARAWGGSGKAAVVASGLFGLISGSAVANVLISGVMTIPLMKRSGFRPTLAGAIEATASTGAQLAPPIMGAAAFILADYVGVPYAEVVFAAIVPALLYYISLFMLVHFSSLRNGLRPDPTIRLTEYLEGLKERWHLLIPLALMIFLLVSQYSLLTVGSYTTCFIVLVSLVRPSTRMNVRDLLDALIRGCRAASEIAIPSAVAGIIVGTLVQTGMALKLQRWFLDLAGNNLTVSLIGAMFLTIIFGMGMPTAAAYLVSAILVAPALQELGVPNLPAHLFILYFSILSMVTPPVALSAYAAAGISGADLWRTGVRAFLLAVPGFIIPYAFTANPALLLLGELTDIAFAIVPALLGVIMIAAASGGYAFGPLSLPLRVLLFVLSPLLIAPELIASDLNTDIVGLIGVVAILIYQVWKFKWRGPIRE